MFAHNKCLLSRTTVVAGITALALMLSAVGCKKQPAEHNRAENNEPSLAPVETTPKPAATTEINPEPAKANPSPPAANPEENAQSQGPPAEPAAPALSEVIRAARTWGPAYKEWLGKPSPDFTLTDIDRKTHKLSEYRGKNVILVFWAIWCGPCKMEIPHLIELRKKTSQDELAILGISRISPMNTTDMIKRFVELNPVINYTMISTKGASLPAPYNDIKYIPCSFFIDKEGKIKLATSGLLRLADMEAILRAKPGV